MFSLSVFSFHFFLFIVVPVLSLPFPPPSFPNPPQLDLKENMVKKYEQEVDRLVNFINEAKIIADEEINRRRDVERRAIQARDMAETRARQAATAAKKKNDDQEKARGKWMVFVCCCSYCCSCSCCPSVPSSFFFILCYTPHV